MPRRPTSTQSRPPEKRQGPMAPGTTSGRPSSSMPKPVHERLASGPLPEPETLARALFSEPISGKVKILFLDVDGTLTDGVIGYSRETDYRNFWVRDGIALQWARDLGVLSVAISGRHSEAVNARMKDLGLEYYGGERDKVAVAQRVLDREGARWEECVMVGDDLPDLALMKKVGWPIAVANAQPEIKLAAKTVLGTYGGRGAVREMVEMVLRHNGTWDQVLKWYGAT